MNSSRTNSGACEIIRDLVYWHDTAADHLKLSVTQISHHARKSIRNLVAFSHKH